MPRINKTSPHSKFEGVLLEGLINQGLEYGELAERMGVTPKTLQNRRKNPDDITVGEIKKMSRITGLKCWRIAWSLGIRMPTEEEFAEK